ncbi:hypothetical protein [Phytohabitans rumicis]|uniref:CBM1 domain-containing protein n=1 Tax=Phytohabitans rumicis TaxID=1076125 RepID=A0A6V8LK18_9ACTN|nr:hypothetical protein [Phytohabitans rumicis]GFJ94969.1 hypothetical protein Prum_086110 [Phytohabitans rumicis]
MRAFFRNTLLCLAIAVGVPAAAGMAFGAAPAYAECPQGTNWDGTTCK